MTEPRKRLFRSYLTTGIFGFVWIVAVAGGLQTLMSYESSPGTVGDIGAAWPAKSKISPPTNSPVLIMLAHPRCPCTQASVGELAKIMAQVQGKVSAYVLFLKPGTTPSGWEDTDLRRAAAKIPGVTVVPDVDGIEARKFGAETSGHTFLYDRHGSLLFSGGITGSRGHSGDNAGENAIVSLVNDHHSLLANTFVFGCSLVDKVREGKHAQCLN
jgi:hypothetical protein